MLDISEIREAISSLATRRALGTVYTQICFDNSGDRFEQSLDTFTEKLGTSSFSYLASDRNWRDNIAGAFREHLIKNGCPEETLGNMHAQVTRPFPARPVPALPAAVRLPNFPSRLVPSEKVELIPGGGMRISTSSGDIILGVPEASNLRAFTPAIVVIPATSLSPNMPVALATRAVVLNNGQSQVTQFNSNSLRVGELTIIRVNDYTVRIYVDALPQATYMFMRTGILDPVGHTRPALNSTFVGEVRLQDAVANEDIYIAAWRNYVQSFLAQAEPFIAILENVRNSFEAAGNNWNNMDLDERLAFLGELERVETSFRMGESFLFHEAGFVNPLARGFAHAFVTAQYAHIRNAALFSNLRFMTELDNLTVPDFNAIIRQLETLVGNTIYDIIMTYKSAAGEIARWVTLDLPLRDAIPEINPQNGLPLRLLAHEVIYQVGHAAEMAAEQNPSHTLIPAKLKIEWDAATGKLIFTDNTEEFSALGALEETAGSPRSIIEAFAGQLGVGTNIRYERAADGRVKRISVKVPCVAPTSSNPAPDGNTGTGTSTPPPVATGSASGSTSCVGIFARTNVGPDELRLSAPVGTFGPSITTYFGQGVGTTTFGNPVMQLIPGTTSFQTFMPMVIPPPVAATSITTPMP